MQDNAGNAEGMLPDNEPELLAQASRNATDIQTAIDSLGQYLRDAAKLVGVAEKATGIFATVADRLGDAACKAAIDTTHGKPPNEVAVSFVKDLAECASMSLKSSNELRRELTNLGERASSVLPALRQAASAMQGLSTVLKTLAARPNRTSVRPPMIVVDMRPAQSTDRGDGLQEREKKQAQSGVFLPASKRRFSN